MRSVLLSIIAITGFVFSSNAQIKVADKAVIQTPGVHCDKCKEKLEFFISKEYGVTSVKVDLKKKTTTVTWLTARTTKENIKTAIANNGYDADDIEREEFAFKRLPKECKAAAPALKPAVPEQE